mgnify:CR=1 FL=1
MKTFVLVVGLLVAIIGCSSTQNSSEIKKDMEAVQDTVRIANDSLEYEIIIIEPGFNAWLVTQRPRGFYTEQFLETRNRRNVIDYNQRVRQPFRYDPNIYMQEINYEPTIHYGYEVNYLLYNYFLFLEQRYNQRFFFSRG